MDTLQQLLGILLLTSSIVSAVPYSEYILAPASRILHPATVSRANGTVTNASSLCGDAPGSAIFNGLSSATYDFGKNIAGTVTLTIGNVDADQFIGLTYSESSLWISEEVCDGTAELGFDEPYWFFITGPGNYSLPRDHERGAFKYLTLVHNTTGGIEVRQLTVDYTPMPHWADDTLRSYTGYFHCDDELINRIWYAGAYTNQLCTIDPKHGDAIVHPGPGMGGGFSNDTEPLSWYLNYTISGGTSVLTDGAKRDRWVWAGDMAIAVPAVVVSTNDLISVANALDSLFAIQDKDTGQLPYAGKPFPSMYSATYHLYTLVGVADYYLYSNDLEYLRDKWDAWKLALDFSLSFIDDGGLMNVTSPHDWLRFGMGGHNIEANAILYHTIIKGTALAQILDEPQSLIDLWIRKAATIKISANSLLWDDASGLYRDNETTALAPQDGNSWAVIANLTLNSEQNARISSALRERWGPYGAPALEAHETVSPFISGFELQAHLLAGAADAALELMRRQWGFMLEDPRMTNSTFVEGYSSDGSLHYPPYSNDARISYAHGWSTGPTSTLTSFVGGIHLLSAGGRIWEISPRLGGLRFVDTGFETGLGNFAVRVNASAGGRVSDMTFSAPAGTKGSVHLPGVTGSLRGTDGVSTALVDGVATGLAGGTWKLELGGNESGGTAAGGGDIDDLDTTSTGAMRIRELFGSIAGMVL